MGPATSLITLCIRYSFVKILFGLIKKAPRCSSEFTIHVQEIRIIQHLDKSKTETEKAYHILSSSGPGMEREWKTRHGGVGPWELLTGFGAVSSSLQKHFQREEKVEVL